MENVEKLFVSATRNKYRFNFKGVQTTEDLWDFSQNELNTLYGELNKKYKEISDSGSLIQEETPETKVLQEKMDIIKYVFDVKKQEAKERENELYKARMRQRILDIKHRKQDEDLEGKSEKELDELYEQFK
ncbi:MAG: hypothetical protein K9H48_21295 [Melioribacteraceae bacterium]|nr:hypothetical protein [Melioribacteraceae bacterium]